MNIRYTKEGLYTKKGTSLYYIKNRRPYIGGVAFGGDVVESMFARAHGAMHGRVLTSTAGCSARTRWFFIGATRGAGHRPRAAAHEGTCKLSEAGGSTVLVRSEEQLSGRARGVVLVANDESKRRSGSPPWQFINAFTELDVPRLHGGNSRVFTTPTRGGN